MIIVPQKYFVKINNLSINKYLKAELISLFCRINTLTIIKIAGSGHIGTSMSAMDLFVWIKYFQFPLNKKNTKDKTPRLPSAYNIFMKKDLDKIKCVYLLNSNGYWTMEPLENFNTFKENETKQKILLIYFIIFFELIAWLKVNVLCTRQYSLYFSNLRISYITLGTYFLFLGRI